MKDIKASELIQIVISNDGKTIWINNMTHCIFRACRIKQLVIEDRRLIR